VERGRDARNAHGAARNPALGRADAALEVAAREHLPGARALGQRDRRLDRGAIREGGGLVFRHLHDRGAGMDADPYREWRSQPRLPFALEQQDRLLDLERGGHGANRRVFARHREPE
jgi:hypothetical protein